MWPGVCRSSVVPESTANISSGFFLLPFFNDKRHRCDHCCSSFLQEQASEAAGASADVLLRFLKNKKYHVNAPGQRPAGVAVCPRAPRVALAGSCSFPGSWMGLDGSWMGLCLRHSYLEAVPLSPALPEAGRKEGAAGSTSATRGCEALQSSPVLSVRAWTIDLEPAAWLGVCCWPFWMRRVVLAGLHAVIRH